ncbi:MAG: T9SS type A sorting domain-containing protein, partial [Candidatus Latescibacteria bacterium]|nr:T9SS type A sorting domain-containing protein [Candidatus Latescibacterota bacterium]
LDMSNSFFDILFYITGKTIPFVIPLLLNSTVICIAGLLVCFMIARKGALIQSWILRVCLVAVILSPVTSFISKSSGLTHITIPVRYPNSNKILHSSGHNETTASQLGNNRHVQFGFNGSEYNIKTDLHDYAEADSEKLIPENHKTTFDGLLTWLKGNSFIIYSIFIVVWTFCSFYFMMRTIVAYLHFRHIRCIASTAKQDYNTLCKSVSNILGCKEPRILITPDAQSVFLAGFFHPCVVLPNDEADVNLATKEIFIHELVHLKRHDYIWNYLCQIGKILLPFQPLVWIIIGKMKETSDFVCDDFVIQYAKEGRSYAVQLYNIAQSFQLKRLRELNGVGFVSKLPLRKRIERILDDSLKRHLKLNYTHILGIVVLFVSSIFISGYVGVKPADSFHALKRSVESLENTLTTQFLKTRAAGLHLREADASERNSDIEKNENKTPLHKNTQKIHHKKVAESHPKPTPRVSGPNDLTIDEMHYPGLPKVVQEKFFRDSDIVDDNEAETIKAQNSQTAASFLENDVVAAEDRSDSSTTGNIWGFTENSYNIKVQDYSVNVDPGPVEIIGATDWENDSSNDSENSRLRQLYGNLDKFSNPKWSPDGRWIGFEAAVAMWVISVEGGKPMPVYDSIGKQLSDETGMVIGGETACWKLLGFTPNSREMTFVVNIFDPERGSINEMVNLNDYYMATIYGAVPIIVSVDIGTGARRTIVEESNSGRWSTDGRYFAYQKMNLEVNITRQRYYNTHVVKGLRDPEYEEKLYDNLNDGLFVLDMVTGEKWFVAEKGMDPCFAPGDTHVIFTQKDDAGIIQLFRIPLKGGDMEQLTYYSVDEDGHDVSSPDVSPDGDWILHSGSLGDESPCSGLFLYYVPTGESFQFNKESEDYIDQGVWSPDGKQILYNTVKYPEKTSLGFYIADFNPEDYVKPVQTEQSTPVDFELTGNFPNPFNPVTTIKFSLDQDGYTELLIYNIMGQKVRELVSTEMTAGIHSVIWDGRDDENRPVSSGVYISRLKMEGKVETLRMTLVK